MKAIPAPGDVIRWAHNARCRWRPDIPSWEIDNEPPSPWALIVGREEEGRYLYSTWRQPPIPLYRWRLRWGDGVVEEIVCAADNWELLADDATPDDAIEDVTVVGGDSYLRR